MPDSKRFLHPEAIKRIARLDLRARHVVEGFLSGQHRSPYFGQSIEFRQHREYTYGDDPRYVDVIEKLKKTFHIANVHFNNYACMWWSRPFPALAFELLMVNKRLGVLDPANPWAVYPNPLDAPNNPSLPDCQSAW